MKDYQAYVCYNQNEYQSDKYDGCYQPLGYVNANSGANEKWISKLGYDASNPLIGLPIETNGNSNTHMTDYYWSQSGNRIVLFGGTYSITLGAGLWWHSCGNVSSYYYTSSGARLLKISN